MFKENHKTTQRCRRERKVRQILEGSWHWRERRYLVNFPTYDSYPEGRPQSQGITPYTNPRRWSQGCIPGAHPCRGHFSCSSASLSFSLFLQVIKESKSFSWGSFWGLAEVLCVKCLACHGSVSDYFFVCFFNPASHFSFVVCLESCD